MRNEDEIKEVIKRLEDQIVIWKNSIDYNEIKIKSYKWVLNE